MKKNSSIYAVVFILFISSFAIILSGCDGGCDGKICPGCTYLNDHCNCTPYTTSQEVKGCENSGHGVYNYDVCQCECDSGWTGVNCDTQIIVTPEIVKGISADMQPSFGTASVFDATTFDAIIKKASTSGFDTIVLDGYNSNTEFVNFEIYVNTGTLMAPIDLPINRSQGVGTVLPFVGDATKPGIPFVSPMGSTDMFHIEYFQPNPLQIKGTFECTVEEFGNSSNTIKVTNGKFGYK